MVNVFTTELVRDLWLRSKVRKLPLRALKRFLTERHEVTFEMLDFIDPH